MFCFWYPVWLTLAVFSRLFFGLITGRQAKGQPLFLTKEERESLGNYGDIGVWFIGKMGDGRDMVISWEVD